MIEVHSVKRELPKSLIVNTYIKDQLEKINRSFGQMTLTIILWLHLTSLLSLLMYLHTSVHSDPPTASLERESIAAQRSPEHMAEVKGP